MDTRIVGTIALVIMIIICAVGMEWEAKAQNFLVVAIIIAISSFIIGILLGPKTEEEKAKGFIGLSGIDFLGICVKVKQRII
jgi:solute carrier family 12 (sodium/potassium/chloride transporter), member 2